jgi:leucine dehydrogenase
MSGDIFDILEFRRAPRCVLFSDADAGLRAVLVLDDMTLGPAAGGIRTRSYASIEEAVDDAAALARAMTIKCALGGVSAGGGKMVVLDHPGLNRAAAFARLGELVQELGGMFHTAGDLGTTAADLDIMARHCQYVQTRLGELSRSVARGLVRCMEACAQVAGKPGLKGLCVAVQGCGAVGSAVAHELARAGADLIVADIDEELARALAAEIGARVVGADDILTCDADIISPCAVGGVITVGVVDAMRGWALCGAANRIVADQHASQRLHARGVLHVPDVVASAGAVVDGVGQTVMGLADRSALIDALGQTALALLIAGKESGRPTDELAEERAWTRIRAAQ